MRYLRELFDKWATIRLAPNMNDLRVAVGLLGVAVTLTLWNPPASMTALAGFRWPIVGLCATVGIIVLLTRSFSVVPLYEVQQEWRDRWNAIRKGARPFGDALDSGYESWRHHQTHVLTSTGHPARSENSLPSAWRELAKNARWPDVGSDPMRDWTSFMEKGAPADTLTLYSFLRAHEQLTPIEDFRRFGTDSYEWFGLRIDNADLEHFLIEEVKAKKDFRDIMVALAYLNLAIGIRQQWTGANQRGFWSLGARWYPPLLRNPAHWRLI